MTLPRRGRAQRPRRAPERAAGRRRRQRRWWRQPAVRRAEARRAPRRRAVRRPRAAAAATSRGAARLAHARETGGLASSACSGAPSAPPRARRRTARARVGRVPPLIAREIYTRSLCQASPIRRLSLPPRGFDERLRRCMAYVTRDYRLPVAKPVAMMVTCTSPSYLSSMTAPKMTFALGSARPVTTCDTVLTSCSVRSLPPVML